MASRPVRVLVVEDDDDDFLLLRDWLAGATDPPFLLERAATYDAGLAALRRDDHDVYLLDYRLGKHDGLQLLRETAGGRKGPVILLTGQDDRAVDVEAMKAGAVDYLPKDRLTTFSLERAIRYALERKRTEEALRQSQKMEAIGRLAGGVAHDFNNLLTVITGNGELLRDRLAEDGHARELAEEVLQAARRAAALTQQLLAFSRKQIVTLQVLDLSAVVADLGRMLRRVIGEDIELVTDLDPAACRVRAGAGQIEQVLLNLAVNARDAMPRGGRLTVQTGAVDVAENPPWASFKVRPGRYARLSVRDTGCGMTEDVRAHLFEPFFTTKGVGKGTGLGLATVYGIVKQNRGYITAASEPGRGSTFDVYFPAVEAPPSALAPPPPAAPAPPGRGTVLVVEDEAGVRRLVRAVLQASGYTVLEAEHGVEALRVCEGHPGPIHLLVTDVVMPQMGGRELAERLAPARPEMRVLFMSGYTPDAVLRHGVSSAQEAFLQKPFAPASLVQKAAQILAPPGGADG